MLTSSIIPSSRMPFKKIEQSTEILNIEGDTVLVSKEMDKMRRLCIVNLIILEQHPEITKDIPSNNHLWEANWNNHFDEQLLNYLRAEKMTHFKHVTLRQIRDHCDDSEYIYNFSNKRNLAKYQHRRHPRVYQSFFYEFYGAMFVSIMESYDQLSNNPNISRWKKAHEAIGVIAVSLLTFVCGPIYILSRWLSVLFPLTFVIILALDGINLFDEVDIFQVIMLITYILLLIVWFGLGIDILMEDKYLWMFLPSTDNMKGIEDQTECDKVGRLIEETY